MNHSFLPSFVAFVLFVVPLFAGETETVQVLAARVRAAITARGKMPDQKPGFDLKNIEKAAPAVQAEEEVPSRPALPSALEESLAEEKQKRQALESAVAELTEEMVQLKELASKATCPVPALGRNFGPPAQNDPSKPLFIFRGPPAKADGQEWPSSALQLDLAAPVGASSSGPEQMRRAIMFTAEDKHGKGWCKYCPGTRERFGNGLPGRLVLEYSTAVAPGTQKYPAWRWKNAKGEWIEPTDKRGQYIAPRDPQELLNWIDEGGPQEPYSAAAAAVGGSMKTGGRIRGIFDLWKTHLGDGKSVSIRWDRTGLQSLSATKLIAGQPWTPTMLAGKFGHVAITTTSTTLPLSLQELGFTYKTLDDGHFSIDMDAVDVRLPKSTYASSGRDEKLYGVIDPISIGFYAYSFFSALYQILNPQVDVGLGGCVALKATMTGDTLTIEFSECPSIHIAAWFKFDLDIQRVAITQSNVHVDFKPQPQNWIRISSRDFPVDDGAAMTSAHGDTETQRGEGLEDQDSVESLVDRMYGSAPRSPQWQKVRNAFIKKYPRCAFAGCKSKGPFQVHHVKPFHLYPESELDPDNLITLCCDADGENHHLYVGHDGDFKGENPYVREDCERGHFPSKGLLAKERHDAKRASKTTQAP